MEEVKPDVEDESKNDKVTSESGSESAEKRELQATSYAVRLRIVYEFRVESFVRAAPIFQVLTAAHEAGTTTTALVFSAAQNINNP